MTGSNDYMKETSKPCVHLTSEEGMEGGHSVTIYISQVFRDSLQKII